LRHRATAEIKNMPAKHDGTVDISIADHGARGGVAIQSTGDVMVSVEAVQHQPIGNPEGRK
jgi:hypothetical protein